MLFRSPVPYDGNRDDFAAFILDCQVYLTLNKTIYDTSEKKILFITSYMTGGTAKAWKEAYLADALSHSPAEFGEFTVFLQNLRDSFTASDLEGEARAQL